MPKRRGSDQVGRRVVAGAFRRNLLERRSVEIDLPEFLVCALEARVAEANDGARPDDCCTLSHYIESELVNLVTLRDVAELETQLPGFAAAVQNWLVEMRE